MSEGTVVLLSGGVDSTVCLHIAAKRSPVYGLFFDYGQAAMRHELASLRRLSDGVLVGLETHKLSLMSTNNGLTGGKFPELSNVVVPGRNVLFLTHAAVLAKRIKFSRIVIGVTGDDYEDFPDCRPRFLSRMRDALVLALDYSLSIDAPLVQMGKAAVVSRALAMGIDISKTRSCYGGFVQPCARCPACLRREAAFLRAGIGSP